MCCKLRLEFVRRDYDGGVCLIKSIKQRDEAAVMAGEWKMENLWVTRLAVRTAGHTTWCQSVQENTDGWWPCLSLAWLSIDTAASGLVHTTASQPPHWLGQHADTNMTLVLSPLTVRLLCEVSTCNQWKRFSFANCVFHPKKMCFYLQSTCDRVHCCWYF